jgi:hypothetical protein
VLDDEDPEKLVFDDAICDLLVIPPSTQEVTYLFDELIRAHKEKFHESGLHRLKKRVVPLADNDSHKRT